MDNMQDYGEMLIRNGEYEKAIEHYTKQINNNGNDLWGCVGYYFLSRGYCYLNLGEYNNAIKDFSKSIERNDCNNETFYNRGQCYLLLNQYENAIEDFAKAVELAPDDYQSNFKRGFCYLKIGLFKNAIEDFTKAINIEPDEIDAYVNRCLCFCSIKQYKEALNDIDKAIQLEPDDIELISLRNEIYSEFEQVNDYNSANTEYEETGNNECIEHLKICSNYYFQEQPQKAIFELSKAYAMDSESVIYFLDVFTKVTGESEFSNFQNSAIDLFKDMEKHGMSKEEIAQYMEEKCKAQGSSIDVSNLHYNPKQGRKLDL